jgi:poly(3-hydroxybutyrate) depolymerase
MDLSVDAEVLKTGVQTIEKETVAAYHAFIKELPGLNFSNFRRDYTQFAAENHAPKDGYRQALAHIDRPGDYYQTMDQDGLTRTWKTHVPPSYHGQPMPVVVVLHGRSQNGEMIEKLTKISQQADELGFISVYPDSVAWFGKTKFAAWDTGNGLVPLGTKTDDSGFVKAVFDKTERQLNTNANFLVAYSNGGMLAPQVMAAMKDRLAAVALVSSGIGDGADSTLPAETQTNESHGERPMKFTQGTQNGTLVSAGQDEGAVTNELPLAPDVAPHTDFHSSQGAALTRFPIDLTLATDVAIKYNGTTKSRTSILNLHGSDDPLIPVDGLSYVPNFANRLGLPRFYSDARATKYWLSVEKINSEPTAVNAGAITGESYKSASGTEYADCIVKGGGHTWFGPGNGNRGADASVSATDMVITFLRTHGPQGQFDPPKPAVHPDILTADAAPLVS